MYISHFKYYRGMKSMSSLFIDSLSIQKSCVLYKRTIIIGSWNDLSLCCESEFTHLWISIFLVFPVIYSPFD